MRILVANDGIDDLGGVNTYLRALCRELEARRHAVAWLHCGATGRAPVADSWGIGALGLGPAIAAASAWRPDVCFSHNMQPLDVERALVAIAPVVKMMHGFSGTCVSGLKCFGWPGRHPCRRVLGPACLGLYLPRRCGSLHPVRMIERYGFAVDQRSLFARYQAIVVASEYMRDEFVRGGAPGDRVHAIPLFAPPIERSIRPSVDGVVVFMGRMTPIKGGDLLVSALADLQERLGRDVPVVMAGDGPERARWTSLASRLSVSATFPGWLDRDAQRTLLARASLLVVPSTWPEPFGLVGLEAAAFGVPSVAFDVGGIRQWLRDGENGLLVRPDGDAVALGATIARVLGDVPLHARLSQGALLMARMLTVDRHVDALECVLDSARTAAAAHV